MTLLGCAAGVAVAMLAVVAAFQFALAAGAPWGRASYGGSHSGRLPAGLRLTSAVAFAVWVLVAVSVLRRAGTEVWAPLPDGWLPVALWIVAGFLAISVVMNGISRSRIERIWSPVCAVALAAVTTVNLLAP